MYRMFYYAENLYLRRNISSSSYSVFSFIWDNYIYILRKHYEQKDKNKNY